MISENKVNPIYPCIYCGCDFLHIAYTEKVMEDFQVVCYDCGIRGPLGDTVEEAVVKWNDFLGCCKKNTVKVDRKIIPIR